MAKTALFVSQNVPKFELYKHNDELFNRDEINFFSSPLKLLCQSQPIFAEMNLGWSPLKIVSVSAVLYPRWPP